jgi:2-dehydro-3-deoxyphosphogluconate aldolase/(4S)-4-hydroxy-2-oxoglutarate aldolase
VLNSEQVVAAMNAGATYIISPNVDDDVIRLTKALKLVSIPGAMTPSEVAHAYKVGADIVKLFPAGHLGTKYIKELRAPLSHIPLLATGGVNEESLPGFLDAGCAGAGVGGRLADKKLLAEKNYGEIRKRAEAFVSLLQGRA